jgi:hypothetical protein
MVKPHFGAKLTKLLIGWPIHREIIKKTFHIREFLIKTLGLHQFRAAFPEFLGVNAKRGKNHIILHVRGAQRLIVVVNDCDSVLEYCHEGSIDYALCRLRPVDETDGSHWSCELALRQRREHFYRPGGTEHIDHPWVFLVVADTRYEHGGDQRF